MGTKKLGTKNRLPEDVQRKSLSALFNLLIEAGAIEEALSIVRFARLELSESHFHEVLIRAVSNDDYRGAYALFQRTTQRCLTEEQYRKLAKGLLHAEGLVAEALEVATEIHLEFDPRVLRNVCKNLLRQQRFEDARRGYRAAFRTKIPKEDALEELQAALENGCMDTARAIASETLGLEEFPADMLDAAEQNAVAHGNVGALNRLYDWLKRDRISKQKDLVCCLRDAADRHGAPSFVESLEDLFSRDTSLHSEDAQRQLLLDCHITSERLSTFARRAVEVKQYELARRLCEVEVLQRRANAGF